jgi:prepilin-type N-terminal cleavage/methylation domain-containing protein
MTRTRNGRTGFTLTELLVAMAVILVLAGIAAMVVPGAVAQDRTTDGAALTRQYLMIAKNRAARDGLPRGLRLIVTPQGMDPTEPTKNPLFVTLFQEIEAPEVLVPNLNQTTTAFLNPPNLQVPPTTGTTLASPYIRVFYTVFNDTMNPTNPLNGTITNRQVFAGNLTSDHLAAIQPGSMLGIPEFNGYWVRITDRYIRPTITPRPNMLANEVELELLSTTFGVQSGSDAPPTAPPTTYPDDYMGASTTALTYRFGVYAPPQPLLGSQTLPLPRNICVDLSLPRPGPAWTEAGGNFDILFAPNGQIINGLGRLPVDGQLFLWVRDYTKAANPLVVTGTVPGPPVQNVYDVNVFRTAGEQQIVALKAKTGSLGVFPVTWPLEGTGVYATGQDPYSFARQGANGP